MLRIALLTSNAGATQGSCACVLAGEFTRKCIIDAVRRRRTYAATDNIALDVRATVDGQDCLMGEEFPARQPAPLRLFAIGTTPVRRVDVIENGTVAYSAAPMSAEVSFTYKPAPRQDAAWIYVRLEQTNGALAWSSPIWIDRR